VTLLIVLGAWFIAGVLATLVLGPRLRKAAELTGEPLEPEPVYVADRSPLRWRLGTLGVVGLLTGSTGMAAAGELPGSAQSIAHHVLGTVGVNVPEGSDAPAEVATGPATTPEADRGPSTSSPGSGAAGEATDPPATAPAEEGGPLPTPDTTAAGSDEVASAGPSTEGIGERPTTPEAPPSLSPEGSDVSEDPAPPPGEESDVPEDPPAEEPPTTTEPPPAGEPPVDPPAEEPPDGGDPGTTTTTTTTTTTSTSTSTSTTLPRPSAAPAG
jgi:hypothetical protein